MYRFSVSDAVQKPLQLFVVGGLSLCLSACADSEWPQWVTGEPSKAELNSYTGPIDMPSLSTDGKEWPNLADVPERPTLPVSNKEAEVIKDELRARNAEGQKVIEDFRTAGAARTTVKEMRAPKKAAKKKKNKNKKN